MPPRLWRGKLPKGTGLRHVALLVALCSLPRLSSRLCCHRRYLNLACLHASPRSQHLSHCLLALPAYPRTHAHVAFAIATATACMVNCLCVCVADAHVFRLRGVLKSLSPTPCGTRRPPNYQ